MMDRVGIYRIEFCVLWKPGYPIDFSPQGTGRAMFYQTAHGQIPADRDTRNVAVRDGQGVGDAERALRRWLESFAVEGFVLSHLGVLKAERIVDAEIGWWLEREQTA